MDANFLQEATRILTQFAGTKFSAQALEVKGPVQEGSNYRWRIISNRFREVMPRRQPRNPSLAACAGGF